MISGLIPAEVCTLLEVDNFALRVKNKTKDDWRDVLVMVQDCYAQDVCVWRGDIRSGEEVSVRVQDNLHFYHFENGVRLRMYSDSRKIYERTFMHNRKRAFVFYSNEAFEQLTRKAIEGLRNFSELEVVYYTINFDCRMELPGVTCRRYDKRVGSGDLSDSQYMQMVKPEILLRALDDGVQDGLFIDSDVQVRHSIESVFERYSSVDPATPVLNRNYWQYLFVGSDYIPQDELSRKMGYDQPKQFQGHGVTNLFLFRKEMRKLFEEWKFWCQEPEIVNDLRKRVYLHDEVIFNVLCWKERIKQIHGNLLFNVNGLKDVKAFMNLQASPGQTHLDFNTLGCGHASQSFAPYDRDDIVGFHCVKDPLVASSINEYILRNLGKVSVS